MPRRIALLTLVALALSSSSAIACSCIGLPLRTRFLSSPIVFTGTVVEFHRRVSPPATRIRMAVVE